MGYKVTLILCLGSNDHSGILYKVEQLQQDRLRENYIRIANSLVVRTLTWVQGPAPEWECEPVSYVLSECPTHGAVGVQGWLAAPQLPHFCEWCPYESSPENQIVSLLYMSK